jgi:hypothetical protein
VSYDSTSKRYPGSAVRLSLGLVDLPGSDAEGGSEAGEDEQEHLETEALLAGVEGEVAVGTLGVVVGRGHASASGVEASAGDQRGGGTGGGGGDHFDFEEWSGLWDGRVSISRCGRTFSSGQLTVLKGDSTLLQDFLPTDSS